MHPGSVYTWPGHRDERGSMIAALYTTVGDENYEDCFTSHEAAREAEAKAAAILDTLPDEHINKTSIEGEGAVYGIDPLD